MKEVNEKSGEIAKVKDDRIKSQRIKLTKRPTSQRTKDTGDKKWKIDNSASSKFTYLDMSNLGFSSESEKWQIDSYSVLQIIYVSISLFHFFS